MFKTLSKKGGGNSLSLTSDTLGSAIMSNKNNIFFNKNNTGRSRKSMLIGGSTNTLSEPTIMSTGDRGKVSTTSPFNDSLLLNSNKLSETSDLNNTSYKFDGKLSESPANSLSIDIKLKKNDNDYNELFDLVKAHKLDLVKKMVDDYITNNENGVFDFVIDDCNLLMLLITEQKNDTDNKEKYDYLIRNVHPRCSKYVGNLAVVTDTENSQNSLVQTGGDNSEISVKLRNSNNFFSGGSELSDIIKSIEFKGGRGSSHRSKKTTSGSRKMRMTSDNSDSSMNHKSSKSSKSSSDSDSSKSSKSSQSSNGNALSRMISNKKSQLHDKFLSKIKSMLSDKLISLNSKVISDEDDNAEIIKRFLYGKVSEENPQLSGFDKITMLNKMSDDEINEMLKKIKDFKDLVKLNKEIKQRREEKSESKKMSSDSMSSNKSSNKSSDMSEDMSSDGESTIGDITGIKEKKSKKVAKKITKTKTKSKSKK